MRDYNSKNKRVVWILVLVIIVLAGALIYSSWLKPAYDKAMFQKQADAYQLGQSELIIAILSQIQQTGSVQIPVGNNQSIVLVPAS